jgi:hypothetical protein
VFVAPTGDDSAAGTATAPLRTIAKAIAQAIAPGGPKQVYVCDGTYGEAVTLDTTADALQVHGSFDCASGWKYDGAGGPKTSIVAPASQMALKVAGPSTAGVLFEDVAFAAANGQNAGESSIAVFASGATLTLTRTNVTAGKAVSGVDATPVSQAPQAAPGSHGGFPGVGPGAPGPGGTSNPCAGSNGGLGGYEFLNDAGIYVPVGGATGEPGPPTNPDNGGTEQACVKDGGGGQGVNGATGGPGAGASSWATLSTSGWLPTGGQPGSGGGDAQGGGGGGVIRNGKGSFGGPGGGAGGCGGTGGAAGTGGGSSIAVLALASTVTLQSSSLRSDDAGRGGNGGVGQPGQPGGNGGAATIDVTLRSCAGGPGGNGGSGGPGGGGAGGLSAGVVWSATAPTLDMATQSTIAVGALGAAGADGSGATTAKAGVAQSVVQLQ